MVERIGMDRRGRYSALSYLRSYFNDTKFYATSSSSVTGLVRRTGTWQ